MSDYMTEIEQVKELISQTKGAVAIMTKVDLLNYFITTIESQKEEIERLNEVVRTLGLSLQNSLPQK